MQKRERAIFRIERFQGLAAHSVEDVVAAEEPLEIQLAFGAPDARQTKPISVTMRTPGHDAELALGFLFGEGVVHDINDIECITSSDEPHSDENRQDLSDWPERRFWPAENAVKVKLAPAVELNLVTLQRNFYTTSSCGVCGKASLQALRAVCPLRLEHDFQVDAAMLYGLHPRLRSEQEIFHETGGIHSAGLFNCDGELMRIREDVGRHNALDKLVGASMFEDELPLRDRLLLLSGRASFELMQKAAMAGIPIVAAVGAPSSLAIALAKEFDITLIGFLREDHFNVYHGAVKLKSSSLAARGIGKDTEISADRL
jgi:FdhD protein